VLVLALLVDVTTTVLSELETAADELETLLEERESLSAGIDFI
jgi:hypothetical protein